VKGADPDWAGLLTETRHPATRRLDTLSPERVVSLVIEEDRRGLDAALGQKRAIARAARRFADTFTGGGTVLLAGAGTSGRLGVLEAAECPPTFGTHPSRIRAALAGGPEAVFRAAEGAEDRAADGRRAAARLRPGDLLIAVSASAVTPFARAALETARRRGAGSVLISCARPQGLRDLADVVIALATGPEVLTGSTRLKAGSATKAVLNAISTAAMVRAGKVYENLMVDLRPGSDKLRDRAVRIVAAASGAERPVAEAALVAAKGEVKVAIVALLLDQSPAQARRRLAAAGGRVRAALSPRAAGRRSGRRQGPVRSRAAAGAPRAGRGLRGGSPRRRGRL
jgi:N-acetylmuramic acid 6-phosphate etherase